MEVLTILIVMLTVLNGFLVKTENFKTNQTACVFLLKSFVQ